MKNIYKFIWTDEAIAGLKEIILYLFLITEKNR